MNNFVELQTILREGKRPWLFHRKTERVSVIPADTAIEAIKLLNLSANDTLLDPVCGFGTFLRAAIQVHGSKFAKNCYGMDKSIRRLLITRALIDPDQSINMHERLIWLDDKKVEPSGGFLDITQSHIEKKVKMPKFNAIVGNPPYNSPRQENNYSTSIYSDFVLHSIKFADKVVMITPSRWYADNGKEYREDLIYNRGLRDIKTIDPNIAFTDVEIKGGVSYFLLDKNYTGNTVNFDGITIDLRKMVADYDMIIKNETPEMKKALQLVNRYGSLERIIESKSTFGIETNFEDDNVINGVEFLCSSRKGGSRFISRSKIKNPHLINKYKVVIPAMLGDGKTNLLDKNDIIKLDPGKITNATFIFVVFDTQEERDLFYDYIRSDKVLPLVHVCVNTQHYSPRSFRLVPDLSSENWDMNLL